MFTLTPKNKQYKGITPQLSHSYWQERVNKESELKTIRHKTINGELSLIRNFKYFSVSPARKEIFTKDTANLFTDFINTKAKFNVNVDFPKKLKPTTAVNWTRHNNGGHIPRIKTDGNKKYLDMFAKRSYIKPNQLTEDSIELFNVLDDIKTDPRHTFSKKKELIEIALKYK
jgi:hypothetical protein